MQAGEAWRDSGYVFTTELGGPLDPNNVSRWFRGVADRAGVKGSLHTSRHTTGTTMLLNNVDVVTVSRVLGHSSPSITTDIYGHTMPEHERAAVATAAAALGLG